MSDDTIERYHMRPFTERLWEYQASRFPLSTQGAALALLAACGVTFGAITRDAAPDLAPLAVAIVVTVIAFFQLRVADEHRDYDEDVRFRPNLPVPRGVVTLAELRDTAFAGAGVQAALTFALHPPLLALLYPIWIWLGLVSVDFFARDTLERRPALSLGLHVAFVPMVALFCVAADQLRGWGALTPATLAVMLLAAAGAAAIEIARKCKAPEDERIGIATYSKAWGPKSAGMGAAGALAVALISALMAYLATGAAGGWFVPAAVVGALALAAAIAYAYRPTRSAAKRLLAWSIIFSLSALGSVGVLPLLLTPAG